jgi:CheY-like chemotaxis protein
MQETRPASPKPRAKATILVVDDSPTIRKLVSMTLESRGYCVVVACDGVDGLAKMQEGLPDLILSDISMPRLDGYQFCKVVKTNKETKHIPVIMLSGNDGLFDKVRGKMAGSANYITKPFEPNHLVREIEKFVKTERVAAPSPAAVSRQPATATQASAMPGRGTVVKSVDSVAAKQLSKKLSGIYIPPGVSSGNIGSSPTMPEKVMQPGLVGNKTAPGPPQPQGPSAKRPAPKYSDEPEIKIFYHSESATTPPPEPALTHAAPQQTFDGNRPAQERTIPAPSGPAGQHPVGAGLVSKAAVTAATQAPKSASPPATGLQPQQSRSAQSGAEVRRAAPQTQYQAPPAGQPAAAPPPVLPPPLRAAPQTQTSIKAACPGCGTIYSNIKPEHIGKYARCKKCETRFLIG